MMESSFVPCLPDTAPFTPEQRAYLNGFLAGLFSRAPTPLAGAAPGPAPAGKMLRPMTILVGSQTGNSEGLAKRAAKEAGKRGFAPTVFDLAQYPQEQIKTDEAVLLITSTYGDGDPPDNAKAFWDFLSSDQAPKLEHLSFSVLALGDSNYQKFCECGKNFDRRFEALGAHRVCARVDCDVDFEEPFQKWLDGVLQTLLESRADVPPTPLVACAESGGTIADDVARRSVKALDTSRRDAGPAFETISGAYDRNHLFPAPLLANRVLNAPGSAKDTRHFEFALDGCGLNYEAGDALGVLPTNCVELSEEIIRALGCSGSELVAGIAGANVSLREALLKHYEITRVPQAFLRAVAEKAGDSMLHRLTEPGVNGELTKFLWGREIIDLLLAHPAAKFPPDEFVALLKKLQPRLYSISSSPKAHGGQVHLTVAVVRYESLGRKRKGVCSTFLAERVTADSAVPVFVHHNRNFRPPANPDAPMIMIGPGTGIAPFRAFLEERRATGARGKNWLFFGDQHEKTDFLYRNELESMTRDGTLARLDIAFSRDQEQKVYVQHRMLEQAQDLFTWLEGGAHFYVCGDARRMARDVDQALHEVIAKAGGRTPEQAAEDVRRLQREKRYQRDVY
jgi:sulfite reductase (NADPH) flavoprotein alpha-component